MRERVSHIQRDPLCAPDGGLKVVVMKALVFSSLCALAACSAPTDRSVESKPKDQPRTYLASIVDFPLRKDDAIQTFAFATWGVKINSVCHMPDGWTIKAGGGVTPAGVLEGEGSNGVSWPRERSPDGFKSLVLLTLYGPVQHENVRDRGGSVIIPATFGGHVHVVGMDDDQDIPLTTRNVRLVPATACHR